MNRLVIYTAALTLLLAACSPGTQPPELEPATQASTTPAPTDAAPEAVPEEPSVTVIPDATASGGTAFGIASGGASGGEAAAASLSPQGTLSISADNTTFVTSGEGELNPVTVPAGGTFYLQLAFTDPDGISSVQVQLRNSPDAGALPTGPFTVSSNDCEAAVQSAPTELTCTVAVTIAADAQDIQEPGERAYAFRPLVTDTAGNGGLAFSWAYLNISQ